MKLLDVDRELRRHSYYAATVAREPAHPPLQGAQACDVAVVGGGLAGLSAALELAERGFSVTLLEARQLGWGASGRNGGQAIHGLACDQGVIEAQLGMDAAQRVWHMSIEALDLLRERIARHAIDCDWRDGYLCLATSARKGDALRRWAERIGRAYAYPLHAVAPAQVGEWIASPRYHSGVFDVRSGHLHPLKYTLGLGRAAAPLLPRACGCTRTRRCARCSRAPARLRTPWRASARHAAAGWQRPPAGPGAQLGAAASCRWAPISRAASRSTPLAASLIPSGAAVCDSNFVLDYFRPTADQRLLYGGRVSYSAATPRHLADRMRRRMVRSFAQLAGTKIEYAWGGLVDITMNRAPDFGRLPSAGGYAANVYYLQGFSGHGLALTGLAGRVVAEAIAGDAQRFDLFARLKHRPFPGGRGCARRRWCWA
jgi:gamma-glutamylputrescine oxidase